MLKKNVLVAVLILASGIAMAIAWPVNAAYDSSAEASNVQSIQAMGYHSIMKAGKDYKFKFSDGTVAYFMRLPGLSSYKFQQVTEAEYAADPGEDYNPQSTSSGGGGLSQNDVADIAMINMLEMLNQFPPNSIIVINGEGGNGNWCGPGTPYVCVYQ